MKSSQKITFNSKDAEPSELAAVIGMLIVLITIGISWIVYSNHQAIESYQVHGTSAASAQINL